MLAPILKTWHFLFSILNQIYFWSFLKLSPICQSLDYLATDPTLFGPTKLKGRLHRLTWVYICQNSTLLEITCRGSMFWMLKKKRLSDTSQQESHFITLPQFFVYQWNFSSILMQVSQDDPLCILRVTGYNFQNILYFFLWRSYLSSHTQCSPHCLARYPLMGPQRVDKLIMHFKLCVFYLCCFCCGGGGGGGGG